MLKNLMEEKQLDFDAPLLSVRRFSSMGGSSEGEDSKRMENFMPKIPNPPSYKPELESGPVTSSGAVPFQWERIPGRPKNGGGNRYGLLEGPPIYPKLPPGRIMDFNVNKLIPKEDLNVMSQTNNVLHTQKKFSTLDENLKKMGDSKDGVKEKGDSNKDGDGDGDGDGDDDDDDDDAFLDALDTLSRNESFFLNCSISGVSGLESQDMKPLGSFSTDPQTRDFMMGRFLPAAKAMASETPQYSSRKQPFVREKPSEVKKVISRNKHPSLYQYRPSIVPQLAQDKEEDDSEDEEYETRNLSSKACGFIPRFCLKNPLFLLSPIPGMKIRNRIPISSVRKVRTQLKTTHVECHNEPEDKSICDESKQTSESNHLTYWSDSQTPNGDESSPYRRSVGDTISPYRNEASQSFFHEGMGFLGIPNEDKNIKDSDYDSYGKVRNNFQDVLSYKRSKEGLSSTSPMVEKTLYVDSVQVVENPNPNPNSNLNSSATQKQLDSPDKNCEFVVKSKVIEERFDESCLDDIPKKSDIDAALPFSFEKLSIGYVDEKMDFENPHPLKEDEKENSYVNNFPSPLPPPLPKSPSESWLGRTLSSISSRNFSSRAYIVPQLHSKKQAPRTSVEDSKWETIVKISTVHRDHLRFSEELIGPLPQQSET